MPVRTSVLIALLMACLIPMADASPRFRPRRVRTRVPWQAIAAGGAAASAVVFAYKVADGIEQGIKTASASEPQGFLQEATGTRRTLQAICIACLLASCAYLAWRLKFLRHPPTDPLQNHSEPSKPSD